MRELKLTMLIIDVYFENLVAGFNIIISQREISFFRLINQAVKRIFFQAYRFYIIL